MSFMKIINPATEEAIEEVKTDDLSSIRKKFHQADQARVRWRKTPINEKLKIIGRFNELLVKNRDSLAKTLTSEMGKPIRQSRNEIKAVHERITFFLENTEKAIGNQKVFSDQGNLEEFISYEPLGIITNISAWNYPYFIGTNVYIPALLTGNTVLYKPSEYATLTGLAVTKLLYEAGIPEDVFLTIIGPGDVGSFLLSQQVQGVFFTGSYETGKKIAQAVSPKLMKLQLELGGKDPIYVRDDVNIKNATKSIADGAFYNNGQSCCAVERIYVHKNIYDHFVSSFLDVVRKYKVGDPMESDTYIGPLARKAQIPHLEYQIKDAFSKGARTLIGGKIAGRTGYYFEPTILVDVDHSMLVMKEETFGPLIGIRKAANDEEAREMMADTEYGLTAGVYSNDEEAAKKLLLEINSGTVYWNCSDRVSPRLPWGGRGHSGMGSTLSILGIQSFVQPKAWHLKHLTD